MGSAAAAGAATATARSTRCPQQPVSPSHASRRTRRHSSTACDGALGRMSGRSRWALGWGDPCQRCGSETCLHGHLPTSLPGGDVWFCGHAKYAKPIRESISAEGDGRPYVQGSAVGRELPSCDMSMGLAEVSCKLSVAGSMC